MYLQFSGLKVEILETESGIEIETESLVLLSEINLHNASVEICNTLYITVSYAMLIESLKFIFKAKTKFLYNKRENR